MALDTITVIQEAGKVIIGIAAGLGAPFIPTVKTWLRKKLSVAETVNQSGEIQSWLGELRVLANADRASVYKFHNGGVFSNKRPIWRVACVHEACGNGVKPASADPVFASRVLPLVNHLFDDNAKPSHVTRLDGLYSVDTDKMDLGYTRAALESQGVKQTIQRPIKDKFGLTIGFVSVDFCDFGRTLDLSEPIQAIAARNATIEDYAMRIERLFVGK